VARAILPDELWTLIEPHLPALPAPSPKGGRPWVPHRAALTGILFVLRSGIAWEDLPREMGCGAGMTCWRRLRDFQQTGVWDRLHRVLLQHLADADALDWQRASVDSSSVRAVFGGPRPAPTPRIGARRAASTTS
jgi:transposase